MNFFFFFQEIQASAPSGGSLWQSQYVNATIAAAAAATMMAVLLKCAALHYKKNKEQQRRLFFSSTQDRLWQELSWKLHQKEAFGYLDGFGWYRLMVHPITFHFWRSLLLSTLTLSGLFPRYASEKWKISLMHEWSIPSGERGSGLWSNIFIILWAKKIEHDAFIVCVLNSRTIFYFTRVFRAAQALALF